MTTNTPENPTTGDKCPWCQSDKALVQPVQKTYRHYDCKSSIYLSNPDYNEQSAICKKLCFEIEARKKAEAELAEIKRDYHQPDLCNERIMKLEAELAVCQRLKARGLLKKKFEIQKLREGK